MAACSSVEGKGMDRFLIVSWPMFCMEPLAPVASRSYW